MGLIMQNALWADFMAQGDNLAHVVQHLYGPERARLDAAGRALRGSRPLVFIGVASAAYLCYPAVTFLGGKGRVASVVYASDALYYTAEAFREADVVICSRSGETAEIVALARRLNDMGIPYVALTNEPESTLAHTASHIVWTDTRKDDLVSINVVTGMMAGALALAAAALGEADIVAVRPRGRRRADARRDRTGGGGRAGDRGAARRGATDPPAVARPVARRGVMRPAGIGGSGAHTRRAARRRGVPAGAE